MAGKIKVREVLFPKKASKMDYFKAAVYSIIAPGKLIFSECDKEVATLDEPKITAIIKNAVPGYNSHLLSLEIESNISQWIIDDETLSIEEKVERIANGIRKYVTL